MTHYHVIQNSVDQTTILDLLQLNWSIELALVVMSKSKDLSSKLHEKHQAILADLLRDEDNKYCADCMAKG